MKKTQKVGGLEGEDTCDGQIKNQEGSVDLDNNKTNGQVAVDKGSGNTSNSSEEIANPLNEEDDEPDIIVLREDKTSKNKTKDENCPSEGSEPRRRSSTRLQGKRPKLVEIITTSDEDENLESDDDFMEEKSSKSKNVRKRFLPAKKKSSLQTASKIEEVSEGKVKSKRSPNESTSKKQNDSASKISKEFTSGAFVVPKPDFHASRTPAIWRIDGKALLQKYTHFEQDGQTLYKNTSTYSGWVANNKDQYYPVTVEFKTQSRKETIVKFLREAIDADDSD
ncbi:uncharacterized protein LOC113208562 isoform X1 [Frankliniella occidentalis]|uniref:Uncharacterized protein LOC113208562 isoform X1 n=1 Tax=Frankliniella occidentalis TaxID=133901 RepID=A0A6J1SKD4_FRAOC|nr:uncharacterized protein LOC113208562 isoform X1 [Frankliniella occidentalis]